jgi:small subunit ribosomal protein S3
MGQKTSPISFRVGYKRGWLSKWFGGKKYPAYLEDDLNVRKFLTKRLRFMGVDRVNMERSSDMLNIIIYTSRPGLIIGTGGSGVERLKKEVSKLLKTEIPVKMEVQEYRYPESSANIMAEQMAEQLEKRMPYRRVLKQSLEKITASKDVKGAKVEVAGRLAGADIARTEHLSKGSLPLQTIRADIDYAKAIAYTTYGTIGIKVWVYKGEIFED